MHCSIFVILITRICFVFGYPTLAPTTDGDPIDLNNSPERRYFDLWRKRLGSSQEDTISLLNSKPNFDNLFNSTENYDYIFRNQFKNFDDIDKDLTNAEIGVHIPNGNIVEDNSDSGFAMSHPAVPFVSLSALIIVMWSIRLLLIGCCSRRHTATGYWLIIRRSVYLAPKESTESSEENANVPYERMNSASPPEPPAYTPSDAPPPAYKPKDDPPAYAIS